MTHVHEKKTEENEPEKPKKPRLLILACGGCNGCHITILDLYEEVLELFDAVDVVRASVIADMNRNDIPESDIALIEGAVCNSENVEYIRKIRERTKTLITLGTCSTYGGIPGLRNYFTHEDTLKEAYVDTVSTVEGKVPDDYEFIPKIIDFVRIVSDIVKVDYMIPGCPPVPKMIKQVLVDLISGKEPKLHSKNLCEECGRERKKIVPGDRKFITEEAFSVMESDLNPNECFLEQGVVCMGPATRAGCEGRCTKANMPCRGCMGPNPNAIEQGCEMSNAMAPIMPIDALVNKEDLPGTFYRYALPSSIIPHLIKSHNELVREEQEIKEEVDEAIKEEEKKCQEQ